MDNVAIAGVLALVGIGFFMLFAMPEPETNGTVPRGPCVYSVGGEPYSMEKSTAMGIANVSECTAHGTLADHAYCNLETGEWWLYVEHERPDCEAICRVSVVTEQPKLQLRCADEEDLP